MVHTEFLPESIDKPSLAVMCKVVDIVRHGNNTLELEIRAYATLQLLQGDVIPRFYGCYNVWGIYGSSCSGTCRICCDGLIHSAGYLPLQRRPPQLLDQKFKHPIGMNIAPVVFLAMQLQRSGSISHRPVSPRKVRGIFG